mmetsp:Transcript_127537/g.271922  ORF Transcript_127537/g.271922 Transcript_127537/m.271922 type:complete len:207 (+) Transcript_127537:81-701(+)
MVHLPVPSGAPPDLLKKQAGRMVGILSVQSAICFLRIVQMWDVVGGFAMACTIAHGWYARRQDMHITVISVWGIANATAMLADIVSGIMSLFFKVLTFDYSDIALVVAIPLVELLAAAFAWELFMAHERNGGHLLPLFEACHHGEAKPLIGAAEGAFKDPGTILSLASLPLAGSLGGKAGGAALQGALQGKDTTSLEKSLVKGLLA